MIGWPKPALGKWELRDTYIYNLQPLPSNKGYCYGSKVMYMDAQTQTLLFVDIYDRDQRLWKCFTSFYAPIPINDGSGSQAALQGDTTSTMFDFQNKHASFAWTSSEVGSTTRCPQVSERLALCAAGRSGPGHEVIKSPQMDARAIIRTFADNGRRMGCSGHTGEI
jgi:hypothetical protein